MTEKRAPGNAVRGRVACFELCPCGAVPVLSTLKHPVLAIFFVNFTLLHSYRHQLVSDHERNFVQGARVNGFDVQAIGWIVTRDACCDAARVFFGLKPRLPRASLGELGTRWHSVGAAVHDHRMAMTYWTRIICPRRTPLSQKAEQALEAFVETLITCCPDLYGYQALRSRCLGAGMQLAASCLCFVVLAPYVSVENSTIGQVQLVLFLMGCWSLAVTIQLWRMYRLVGSLLPNNRQSLLSRRQDRRSFSGDAEARRCPAKDDERKWFA